MSPDRADLGPGEGAMRSLAALLLSGCCAMGLDAAPPPPDPADATPAAVPVAQPARARAPVDRSESTEATPPQPHGDPAMELDPALTTFEPLILFSTPQVVPDRILSMCGIDDVIVWNCTLPDGAGAISLCAADRDGTWVQLRAGHPDRPVVAVPGAPAREASELTFREEETGDGSIQTIEAREPGRVATLIVRSAESPSGLLEPALLQLDVANDSGDAMVLRCDARYGLMGDGGLLETLLTRAP